MFQHHSKQNKNKFISYAKHINDKKLKQLQQLAKVQSKCSQNNSEIHIGLDEKSNKTQSSLAHTTTFENTGPNQTEKIPNYKIDEKATILRGKLVYLEQGELKIKNNNDLLQLLRQNKIKIKEYINGDKEKILSQIKACYRKKEEDKINVYIEKNLKNGEKVEVDITPYFEQVKDHIFE